MKNVFSKTLSVSFFLCLFILVHPFALVNGEQDVAVHALA